MTIRIYKDMIISQEEVNAVMINLERRQSELTAELEKWGQVVDAQELTKVLTKKALLVYLIEMKSNLTKEDMIIE